MASSPVKTPVKTGVKTALVLGSSLLALSLAACGERAQTQSASQAVVEPLSGYETVSLPAAPAAAVTPVAQSQGYALAERAYGLQEAFYDAPPAYGFDYDGRQGLAWETEDDWSMYADPYGNQEVYYYYRPGESRPYFVRDGDYGYGFDNVGALIALFDSGGRYLDRGRFAGAAPLAGRYYAHGRDLRSAARQGRAPVRQAVWNARAPRLEAAAQPWIRAARDDGDWRAWREQDRRREAPLRFKARPQQIEFERDRGPDRNMRAEQAAQDRARREAQQTRQAEIRQAQARQQQAQQAARAQAQQQIRQDQARKQQANAQRVQEKAQAATRVREQQQAARARQVEVQKAQAAQRQAAQRQTAVKTAQVQQQQAQRQQAAQAKREQAQKVQAQRAQARAERADQAANHASNVAAKVRPDRKPDRQPNAKGGDHERRDRDR